MPTLLNLILNLILSLMHHCAHMLWQDLPRLVGIFGLWAWGVIISIITNAIITKKMGDLQISFKYLVSVNASIQTLISLTLKPLTLKPIISRNP